MIRPFARLSLLAVASCSLLLFPDSAAAQRLDGSIVPDHYNLAFDVDLARARFSGEETIRVRLLRPSRRLVLHALDIQFQEVEITSGGSTQRAAVTLDGPTETAAFSVPREVAAGPAELHIRYTGILNNKLRGFYLSQANNRRYAVTQLESTDARRAFPSFDEPAYKATFAVSLTIDAADSAISNGRLLSDTPGPGDGRHTLKFETSPKMSSYLVAMTVGDFQCLEGEAESTPIRICATPDKRELGHLALDAAKQILSFYNRYYSIKYPFKKLDVVAVPDFAAGAMENTAAIFYREVDLLADAKTASLAATKRIWSVLAHEMAHQWFGDLVTMRWWDDLWLNEGFATWMEKRPLAAAKPEWKMELDEMVDVHAAMNLDALASTRAIHSTVETPAEIEGSFDTIAYEKGASVLRMVEGYVGAEAFRAGVNAYLEQFAYGNATSADFWTALARVSGKPVDRILPTFVNQPGVPLVEAALSCSNNRTTLTLTSRRFLTDPSTARLAPGNPQWELPICLKTREGSDTCQVVQASRATLPLAGGQCVPWVFVNGHAQGYFRTAYSPAMLEAMAPDLPRFATEAERLSLIGDEWALVRAGVHGVRDYLTLISGLAAERTSAIVQEIALRLNFINAYLVTDRSRPELQQLVARLFTPIYAELGLESQPGDPDDRRALRATVIETLADAGSVPELASAARLAVDRAIDGATPLDGTAANAIVRVAATRGDAALWQRLFDASKKATAPEERYRYLYGLPAFTDPALIERGLNVALTADLRAQDTPGYLTRFLANQVARPTAWSFIKRHWNELSPKVTISLGDVRLVQGLGVFCDTASRDDIRAFFAEHKLPAASRALDQTLERINNCIAIRNQQTEPLERWLSAR